MTTTGPHPPLAARLIVATVWFTRMTLEIL
jgi:hypothetical protein